MKEYGGYIELDEFIGAEYYTECLALNSGRSCLGYLIENRNIKKIYIPYFLCDTVRATCEMYGMKYELYGIKDNFEPDFSKELQTDEYIYIVNFYGQLSDEKILSLKEQYKNIILDNAQAFFRKPISDIDTIYICRKFFGVADGAYLFTTASCTKKYQMDVSFDRMQFLLGRYEKDAFSFYEDYVRNNEYFSEKPVMYASKISRNILKAIDYELCRDRRTSNYKYLYELFKDVNGLNVRLIEGAFAYPLLVNNGDWIRKELIKRKIYIPTLWPDVFSVCQETSSEYKYARDILPIPVDQRYSNEDMKAIGKVVNEIIRESETLKRKPCWGNEE